jgi:peptidoglycan/xylan/chitin deacetylase (PgdA/CDA1 family)
MTILYYHGVANSQRDRFAQQMRSLQRHAHVVPANWHGDTGNGLVCAITFDDAFVSVIKNALPELAIRGLPCTIFVPVGFMGSPPGWAMEAPAEPDEIVADEQCLRRLSSQLVTLGSHTVSHCHLSGIPRDLARAEIERSRSMLAAIAGQDVRLISFPYGDYDLTVVQICEQAGYDLMFTIAPTPVDLRSRSRLRGRVSVSPDDGPLEFYLKISGSYRWIPIASALKHCLMLPFPRRRTTGERPDGNQRLAFD